MSDNDNSPKQSRLRASSENKTDNPPPPSTIKKWSDDVEKVIKDMGDSCIGYKWMCIIAAKQSNKNYDILMYSMILLGPLAGVFSTISVSYPQDNNWLQIIAIFFAFLSGVVSTSLKFSQLDEKTTSYKQAAAKYASLEGNIRRQLNLTRDDRVGAGEYLEWVSTSYDELFASTPLMPDSVYKNWQDFAKKNGITLPKEMDGVITEGGTDQLDQLCTLKLIDVNNNRSEVKLSINNEEKIGTISDLSRFTDGKMRYEIARMFGTKG